MARQPRTPSSPPARRGRPLDSGLRQRLLDHTIRVLLETGYAKFSMIAVAQSAHASKETLYRQFGDKDGLLHAALTSSAGFIAPLLQEGLTEGLSREARLARLGLNYLRACYRPGALALQRIAIADGPEGLGRIFWEEISEKAVVCVADEFQRFGSATPRRDAETFLGSILGKDHERLLLGAFDGPTEPALTASVEHAMRLFAPYLAGLDASPTREAPTS